LRTGADSGEIQPAALPAAGFFTPRQSDATKTGDDVDRPGFLARPAQRRESYSHLATQFVYRLIEYGLAAVVVLARGVVGLFFALANVCSGSLWVEGVGGLAGVYAFPAPLGHL
jgi:hypothetical protein